MPNQELFIDPKIKREVTTSREQQGYMPRRLLANDEIKNNFARVEKKTDRIGEIAEELGAVVFGQDPACNTLARHVAIAEAGWADPKRPLCSVLFLGPTGTGKTEMARALSKYLFGDANADRLKIVRMQEYMTPDKINKLTGVAPGFAGSEEEPEIPHEWLHATEDVVDPETGEVTTKMKQSIIVFDEFEKAHPDIRKALLSVLDEGTMNARVGGNDDENNGTKPLNFRNSYIILTSNIGSEKMHPSNTASEIQTIGTEAVKKRFKDMPEFLGRLTDTVAFKHLGAKEYKGIFDKLLSQRIRELQEANPGTAPGSFTVSEEVRHHFINNIDPELGGRSLRNMMDHDLFSEAAQSVAGMTGDIRAVLEDGKVHFYTDNPERKAVKRVSQPPRTEPSKKKSVQEKAESLSTIEGQMEFVQELSKKGIEQAKKELGKDFIGPEDIKSFEAFINENKIFVDASGKPLKVEFNIDEMPAFTYTEEDLAYAKKPPEAYNEMLILRPSTITIGGTERPLTARAIMNLLAFDPEGKRQSLIDRSDEWWGNESWQDTLNDMPLRWAMVTKEPLGKGTRIKDQRTFLEGHKLALERSGCSKTDLSRRTTPQALWDTVMYYWKNRENLLENENDILAPKTDKGNLRLILGEFGENGIGISAVSEDIADPKIGVCPQR